MLKNTLLPKKNEKLCLKTEPLTAGADAMVYFRLLFIQTDPETGQIPVASVPAVTISDFMQRFRLFLEQCRHVKSGLKLSLHP